MVIARWARGFESLYKGVDAQSVADEIQSIGESVTPEQIVERGRDENTELHKCFDWNDTSAADKWRKQEARNLVHHLVISRQEEDDGEPEVRVFYKPQDARGYKQTEMIVRREDEYLALLQRALGELRSFQRKYSVLSNRAELLELIGAVEEMVVSA